MQYSTNNKELYTALAAALTELTCFGKSALLQQLVEKIKQSNNNTTNNTTSQLDHNIFATLFIYALLNQRKYADVAQSIMSDPKNHSLFKHLRNIKELDQHELELAIKTLKEIRQSSSPKPQGKAGK